MITLNNEKKRNPLSFEVLTQLYSHLEYFEGDQHTKVIILKAKGDTHNKLIGPVFSAGHDLKEIMSKGEGGDVRSIFELLGRVCMKMRQLPQPVIAQVRIYVPYV